MRISPEQLIQQLKALSDLTRMRLLVLCLQGECSVSELTDVVGESQPRVSQHLRALCDAGLLARQRDGKRMFYRIPSRSDDPAVRSALFSLIPEDDPSFVEDKRRLLKLRHAYVNPVLQEPVDEEADRAVFRAILDLAITARVGSLLDIGCGRGQILKLLASQANRAIGVDIDAGARQLARAELLLAGVPNCSLRKGDMYRLPFAASEFDTIILDDVLGDAEYPVKALKEANRLLKPGGRLLLLLAIADHPVGELKENLAAWCAAADLRLAPPRIATDINPVWMLATASNGLRSVEAA